MSYHSDEMYLCGTPGCPRSQMDDGYCCEPCRTGDDDHSIFCELLVAAGTNKRTLKQTRALFENTRKIVLMRN